MACGKHPRHRQSPGVCSLCLGEKLSNLSAGSSANREPVVSTCSSSFSSSGYSSLEGSPMHHKYRMASMKHVTMSGVLRTKQEDVFRKSKSLAAVERVREDKETKNKKKKGFWSKLLKLKKKKDEAGLAHSNMATARVH